MQRKKHDDRTISFAGRLLPVNYYIPE